MRDAHLAPRSVTAASDASRWLRRAANCIGLGLAFTLLFVAPSAAQVTPANDAPDNVVPGAQTVNEDVALVFSSANGNGMSVRDPDDGDNAVIGDEVMRITLSAGNGTMTLGSTAGLTFTSGANGTAAMTFSGSITNLNNALSGLSFASTAGYNGAAQVQILTDDLGNFGTGGARTDSDTVAITVNAVNDAPVNTVPGTQNINEDIGIRFSTSNGNRISVGDVDDADNGVTGDEVVQLTLSAANGTITLGSAAGLTFTSGANGTAAMTVRGSLSALNTALDGAVFAPAVGYNGPAELRVILEDLGNFGAGGARTDSDTVAITVNAVNDAPLNRVPGPQSVAADGILIFSAVGGNGFFLSDVDDRDNSVSGDEVLRLTLSAANGTITLGSIAGLTFTSGADGTAAMTFSGSINNLNSALSGLRFAPTPAYNGSASVQLVSDDLGNFGSGGPLTDSDSVAITVGTPPVVVPIAAVPVTGAPPATGARAAALKKCAKKKPGKARSKCKRKANKLPV
jgi:hypothetical protein